MGGLRFIPFHPEHAALLGNTAELYYEYLKFRQGRNDGIFQSVQEIQKGTNIKRSAQEKARQVLLSAGWIECEKDSKQSPKIRFRVIHGTHIDRKRKA